MEDLDKILGEYFCHYSNNHDDIWGFDTVIDYDGGKSAIIAWSKSRELKAAKRELESLLEVRGQDVDLDGRPTSPVYIVHSDYTIQLIEDRLAEIERELGIIK